MHKCRSWLKAARQIRAILGANQSPKQGGARARVDRREIKGTGVNGTNSRRSLFADETLLELLPWLVHQVVLFRSTFADAGLEAVRPVGQNIESATGRTNRRMAQPALSVDEADAGDGHVLTIGGSQHHQAHQ